MAKLRIFLEDSFDSAHRLPNVPADHKCSNLHGHTYHVRIEVGGEVDKQSGWIIDYADVKAKWEPIKAELDHRLLNDIPGLSNPTCEIIADWLYARLVFDGLFGLERIELRETDRCGVVIEAYHG